MLLGLAGQLVGMLWKRNKKIVSCMNRGRP
jgi:hypothetical protein